MNRFKLGFVISCVATPWLSPLVACAAPPNVTALFPAGCQAGQSVEVTAQGTLGDKPQAWSSRDGVKVEFAESGSKFKVTVAPETPAGVAWLRFFNAEGSSTLRPFVVGTLPDVLDKEPNNAFTEAQRIDSPSVVVNGVLEKNGDVDTFATTLKAGQTLVASVASRGTFGSAADCVLQILGPKGFVLEHNDDDHGIDPQIAFTAPADGDYAVRLFAFPAEPNSSVVFHGGPTYVYRLTLSTGPFVDHTEPMSAPRGQNVKLKLHGWNLPPELAELPVEPTEATTFELRHPRLANTLTLPVEAAPAMSEAPADAAGAPQELTLPTSVTGLIAQPRQADTFRFKLSAKQQIVIRTEARSAFSLLDPVLRITKPDGSVLQELDDGAKGDFDPDANITAPVDGEYRLTITDRFGAGGSRFFYRLSFQPAQPDFALTVAGDSFVLSGDKPLEIPVTIDRQRGFADDIEITATGLPDKVTAAPVTSAAKGDSAKSVKLVLKSEPGVIFSGPLHIVGRRKSEPPAEKPATTTLPVIGHTHTNLWLTVAGTPSK